MPPTKLVTLSQQKIAIAIASNPHWSATLGWNLRLQAIQALIGTPGSLTTSEFARAVATWQAAKGLDVDGILGPDTWKAMRQALSPDGFLTGILPVGVPACPDGLAALVATFGDPQPLLGPNGLPTADHEILWRQQILARARLPFAIPTSWDGSPVRQFEIHRALAPLFEAVFEEIDRLGLKGELHSWGGTYAFRKKRGQAGGTQLSVHTWAIAVDLNVSTNAIGTPGDMSPRIIEVFRHFGFKWGGDFVGQPDPMHFQYVTGY